MIRRVIPFAVLLGIASCSGAAVNGPAGGSGTETGTDDGTTETSTIPDTLAVNLKSVSFDGTNLQVTIDSLDSTPVSVTYLRDSRLDLSGYTAFRMQEDALDRLFVALGAVSTDGSVQAVTVGDGGQFNTYFAGGAYDRSGTFDRPTGDGTAGSGQVSYAGSYVAVTNMGAPRDGGADDVALPITAGTDTSLTPRQPVRVQGDIFLNANFSDNSINGAIYNRQLVDTNYALVDVILVPGTINDDGTFEGVAEYDTRAPIGTYGGIFGGTDAHSVAGLVHLTEFDTTIDNEQEHGVFVLTQCGPDNTLPVCTNVASP
ncbi:hypothetical protein [Rhodobacter aestuarii]|nr:hypothetical protein [Rhodobacter aestuarii]